MSVFKYDTDASRWFAELFTTMYLIVGIYFFLLNIHCFFYLLVFALVIITKSCCRRNKYSLIKSLLIFSLGT